MPAQQIWRPGVRLPASALEHGDSNFAHRLGAVADDATNVRNH